MLLKILVWKLNFCTNLSISKGQRFSSHHWGGGGNFPLPPWHSHCSSNFKYSKTWINIAINFSQDITCHKFLCRLWNISGVPYTLSTLPWYAPALKDIPDWLPKFPRKIAFENIMKTILMSQIAVNCENCQGREPQKPPVDRDTLITPCLNYISLLISLLIHYIIHLHSFLGKWLLKMTWKWSQNAPDCRK